MTHTSTTRPAPACRYDRRPLVCDNGRSEAGPRANGTRPLAHSLDLGEEGLAMKATHKACDASDCTRPARSPGSAWCDMHYQRLRKYGTLDLPPERQRFDNRGLTCAADGCQRAARNHGFCGKHREQVRRFRDPDTVMVILDDPEARFWSRVDKTDSCWLWTGPLTYDGYAVFGVDKFRTGAHRWAWKFTHGAFPAHGLQLDHLCRVRHCVNPDHLEPVTPLVNTRRAMEPKR